MTKRGRTPGLIRRRRKGGDAFYWSAQNLSRDLRGFPDPLIRLPPDATTADLDRNAVRLISEHAPKGHEFETLSVADLGRAPSMSQVIRSAP